MPGDAITLILRKVIDVFGRWLLIIFRHYFRFSLRYYFAIFAIIFACHYADDAIFIPASISLILRFSFSKMSLFG
jgi:hypothetical protein